MGLSVPSVAVDDLSVMNQRAYMLIPIQIKRRHPACIQPVQLETHADVEQREQIFTAVQVLQPEVPADIQRSETIPI